MATKPPYRMHFEKEVPAHRVQPPGSPKELLVRMVEGTEMSIMLASRDPGYHTHPHRHEAEQFNYILEGELWIYVEENGYRCVKGDVMRIPRNKVHWAWNRGDTPCVMLEAHSPPLTGDPALKLARVSLLGPDEDADKVLGVANIPKNYPAFAEIEERSFREPSESSRKP